MTEGERDRRRTKKRWFGRMRDRDREREGERGRDRQREKERASGDDKTDLDGFEKM